ncbi:MAG TPA: threonine-phosphate decarboxylase CobD [Azospirillaceae bacterium]|nr:threonine-phosphate decarboxylase CobD [Azospirillaceae bacterium]
MHAVRHGGDAGEASRLFPRAPGPWLDLSTGINPIPYPVGPLPSETWTRLPGSNELDRLRRAAASAYGVPDAGCVVAAPGTQILINLLPRLRPPGRVAVLGPTYGEHAPAWAAAGHRVDTVREAAALEDVDVAVVVNPNNPDGRALRPDRLHRLADALGRRGGLLVVDEAFADVSPEVSVAGGIATDGLVVLRSFGKFHGLAGLRLGFALASGPLAARIEDALGPWAVSGPALAIGAAALSDAAWAAATRARLAADARCLDGLLHDAGLDVVGGTALYRLVASDFALEWFTRLGEQGIYVRRFDHDSRLLRFGLPGTEADWRRLGAALRLA